MKFEGKTLERFDQLSAVHRQMPTGRLHCLSVWTPLGWTRSTVSNFLSGQVKAGDMGFRPTDITVERRLRHR